MSAILMLYVNTYLHVHVSNTFHQVPKSCGARAFADRLQTVGSSADWPLGWLRQFGGLIWWAIRGELRFMQRASKRGRGIGFGVGATNRRIYRWR